MRKGSHYFAGKFQSLNNIFDMHKIIITCPNRLICDQTAESSEQIPVQNWFRGTKLYSICFLLIIRQLSTKYWQWDIWPNRNKIKYKPGKHILKGTLIH